ncbi:thermonuclease family protein [Hyphomicrobium sp.]|uniref:thermonuclease family protein n=1 Tax=Hyphomicrobium sp. TaxID=82 RepID=UPI0025C07B77|nr:thermonuclease family protein [Hyphomicrobium sp.]MCC7253325.1 thermonuclease family protein [Hyphomicrobium sp.]
MVWWRKRNEGFEWRDYVRTTILVRREQRRQRLKDVQAAAAAHVKDAGKRGLDAGLAGARNAGTGTWAGMRRAGSSLKAAAQTLGAASIRAARATVTAIAMIAAGIWRAVSAVALRVSEPLGPVLEPLLSFAREPRSSLALKIVAALAGLGAAYRTWTFGFDGDAIFATILFAATASIVLLAYLTDPYRGRHRAGAREGLLDRLRTREFTLPGERRVSAGLAALSLSAVAAVGALGAVLYNYGPTLSVANLTPAPLTTGALPDSDPSKIEGRATAITGDTLRVAGTRILLDGIEAPEATQSCRRRSGTWRCGAAAKEALADLVRGRRVSCDIIGEHGTAKRARCQVGGADIAERLVRNGSVFADSGFWGSYADVENEARTQKVGLWAGEADRPQDYRDKRWQEAKKSAPEGCPIKGPIRAGARTYILPWAPSYDSIRLRTSRGERWFCSESEAEAAGWTRASQS